AKEVYGCDLPVMVTMTFEKDGRSLFGTDALTAAVTLESLGADAIGINCGAGPAWMEDIVRQMASVTKLPVIAKPNAGLPALDADGNTFYDMDADTFVEEMKILAKAGATILGGCCGTSPQYIDKLTKSVDNTEEITANLKERMLGLHKQGRHFLSSQCMTLEFGLEDPFMIVGERINPTGKKKLQEQLRNNDFELVKQFAEEQEENGASVLDINMGMSGIDEKEMMLKALEETAAVTNLPLSLDSSHVDVLEQALRNYPGRALVNSVSLEKEKFERLLPIVKKYGAMFILLPLSDKGLPESLEEKIQIINTIVSRAISLGMTKDDIVVDGLVATVGANKKAALETLETIRFCKENGLATICGLSNISFGLPERSYVNTAFLTMAIREGLTMAISNPSQDLLVCSAFASDLLLNKEGSDIRYIDHMSLVTEKKEQEKKRLETLQLLTGETEKKVTDMAAGTKEVIADTGWHGKIKEAVLKGNKKGIGELTKKALDEKEVPQEILNRTLLPAINEVGDLFDQGKYFLPQLIASAEAMKNAIEVLEPFLMSDAEGKDMPAVVIATVEGDIHDIGKNLVALMLKNYGFNVIDLGKDVPKEKIIQAAKENHAQIIALSALMTTTMQQMRHVVDYAKEQGVTAKIMIGGAVITQDYADEIGADGYSKDAAEAVKLAQRLLRLPLG
ncbi:MAG: dihydropteroate synthase, partial [Lachnospiraceae bacterium]|nr:dihydropteroate synthase [Lachnospiraceae bacterium]